MSIYNPPFLYPIQPTVYRQGMRQAYGQTDDSETFLSTLKQVEDFAPPIARLIAGLTPEEQLVVLQSKVSNLQKYADVPIIGALVQQKIDEYNARIIVLQKQAKDDQRKRMLQIALLGGGVLLIGTLILRQIQQIGKGA